ncbi:MAG: hypothetical protein AB1757_26780 [Acidobacteriota bacterium]
MNIKQTFALFLVITLMASSSLAFADALKLHPNGFGEKSKASWKAKQGLPDNCGNGKQALLFEKNTTTATFAAGVAVVNGLEGKAVADLTGLSWESRDDGHCSGGAPRWDLFIKGASGTSYTVFLGCAGASHSAGSAAGWTLDAYSSADILNLVVAAGGADAVNGTISGLIIVFDEGIDTGVGFVYLDNISVEVNGEPTTFTSACDNGQ